MGQAAFGISSNSLKTVEWMWQANEDPWSNSKLPVWEHYSDVENLIIERAYVSKQKHAVLDDYYIDFIENRQISNKDSNKQRPVKRVLRNREDKHLREARFVDLPTSSGSSFGGQYGWISPFILEVRSYLGLKVNQLPSKNSQLIPMIVEKAAEGIIEEGKHLNKHEEAKEIANTLREHRNKSMKKVWKCCAYLYTLESFLYKTLNATMRLVGDKNNEHVWKSKIRTLGPFCLLLWDDPFNVKMTVNVTLYRGANLAPIHIAKYDKMAKNGDQYGSFQAFLSCSRNMQKAEEFGSTLFIMEVESAFIADLSEVSEYPDEEENLITPGVCFRVTKVEFNNGKNKHYIYLKLKQRFASELMVLFKSL